MKRSLKKFSNQSDYEQQKDELMNEKHVILFDDTQDLLFCKPASTPTGGTLITFTINNTIDTAEYNAYEGMTWWEWLYSDFNVMGFSSLGENTDDTKIYESYWDMEDDFFGNTGGCYFISDNSYSVEASIPESYKKGHLHGYAQPVDIICPNHEYVLSYDTWGLGGSMGGDLGIFGVNDNYIYTYNLHETWTSFIERGEHPEFTISGENVLYNGQILMTPLNTPVKPTHCVIESTNYMV